MTNLAISLLIGVLTGAGVYLVLRVQTFPVVLGLTLMSYGVNLFLFVMGRLHTAAPAVIGAAEQSADALPQALVLTAIVIAFAMTAFVIVLALKARAALGNDHVDGMHIERANEVIERRQGNHQESHREGPKA